MYNSVELVDTDTETLVSFMCNNLKGGRHEVSDSVKIIGESSFQGCSGLKHVVLNEGLNTIDSYAFMSTGLESIDIPACVRLVGAHAFDSCLSLSTLLIEEDMKGRVGDNILENSSLVKLRLPRSLWSDNRAVSESAFSGSRLGTVVFGCVKDSAECVGGHKVYKGKEVEIECEECI